MSVRITAGGALEDVIQRTAGERAVWMNVQSLYAKHIIKTINYQNKRTNNSKYLIKI